MKDCHIHMNSMVYQSAIVLLAGLLPSFGALTVDSTVSHNCVFLQNAMNVVKGTTTARRTVTVSFKGQQTSAVADASGAFAVKFNPGAAESTPQTVTVSDGVDSQTVTNVLVGEVWYVSGQSNAEYTLDWEDFSGRYEEWMYDVDYPNLRMLTVPDNIGAIAPDMAWKVFNAANAPKMSALGFFFAKELHKAKNLPVGIVVAAKGGSAIGEWLTPETIASNNLNIKGSSPSRCVYRSDRVSHVASRGVIWYQGETDGMFCFGYDYYMDCFKALIGQWRAAQANPDYPVITVGLVRNKNFGEEARWPAIRAAQETVAASMSNVACVPAIDLGDSKKFGFGQCVHPDDKPELAARVCLAARNVAYGEKVRYRCPLPTRATLSADKSQVIVTFPESTTLVWKNGTPAAYKASPFRLINEEKTLKNSPTPSISADGHSLILDKGYNKAAVTVDYCRNQSMPEIELFDANGFPVPAFNLIINE